ncbi:Maltokinase [compost metagenome]
MPPYGYYWFYLADSEQMPSWHVQPVERMPELPTLVLVQRLDELMKGTARELLENESLPRYLPGRRWFSTTQLAPDAVHLSYAMPLTSEDASPLLAEIEVAGAEGAEHYQLPLAAVPETSSSGNDLPQHLALARLRRGRRVGLLTDAFSLPRFSRMILRLLRESAVLEGPAGELQFLPAPGLVEMGEMDDAEVRILSVEQSNSSALIGGTLLLKLLRRVFPGVHPEAEMGGYLSRRGFANIAPMLGEVRRIDAQGQPHTLMLLQGYLSNQGDAWNWTQNQLERALRTELTDGNEPQGQEFDALEELRLFAGRLGQRLGEMHQLLADSDDEPDFGMQRSTAADSAAWATSIGKQIEEALDAVERLRHSLDDRGVAMLDSLQECRQELLRMVATLAGLAEGGVMIRVHGDLHLGQVLVVQDDAYLIDFEGEPGRPLAERRKRHSPLKDVAGVLRSIDYAAAMAIRSTQSLDSSEEAAAARMSIAQRYRRESREAFLQAYRLAAADLPHEWRGREGEGVALALFSLEKAAYEILYESGHRPDWIGVPLQGMVELARQLLGVRK